MIILIPGAPVLSIALNANVLATVLLPVSLVFMVMLANDTALMGPWANKRSTLTSPIMAASTAGANPLVTDTSHLPGNPEATESTDHPAMRHAGSTGRIRWVARATMSTYASLERPGTASQIRRCRHA